MAQNSFVKSFLPGLVLGVIVGALAGAFLPPLLESRESFDQTAVNTPTERTAPTAEQVEEARRQMEGATEAPVTPVAPTDVPATDVPATEPEATPDAPAS
jgi:hypothetical protein